MTQLMEMVELSRKKKIHTEWLKLIKLSLITKGVFLRLMRQGSSPLCRMLDREIRCGSPKHYTPAAIAYIYDLDIGEVLSAAEQLGENTFESGRLSELFEYIQVPDRVYRK